MSTTSSRPASSPKPRSGPAGETTVRLRLIRADDAPPTNPLGEAYVFGLQDTKNALTPPRKLADGRLAFDFELRVKIGPKGPVFLGPFASGPAKDRFVYLGWASIPRRVWINRVKARLSNIDAAMVEAAQTSGRVLEADMTGRKPGGHTVPWTLADG